MNERLDTELSAATRQLIDAARGADDPSAEDEARVKARWLASIAAGAGVSSLSEGVRAAASTSWGLKAAGLVVAAAMATAGVYSVWSANVEPAPPPPLARAVVARPAPSAAPAPDPLPPAPSEPVTSAEEPIPAPVASAAEESSLPAPAVAKGPAAPLPAEPARAPSATRSRAVRPPASPVREPLAAPVASAPASSGQLSEEIALLSEIRGSLQQGAASRALERLSEYRRRFASPNLAMEAEALRVDALCRAGEREAARAAAAAFAASWPGSPLEQRVAAACP